MKFKIRLSPVPVVRILLLSLLVATALVQPRGSRAAAAVTQGVGADASKLSPSGDWANTTYSGYDLFFSDEFEVTEAGAPNPSHWDYDVSYVRNNELQCYTDDRRENVRVENRTFSGATSGYLVLELRKEQWVCPQDDNKLYLYTSGAITSRKRNNGDYLVGADSESGLPFGIYEIRAKIPSGRGTWPAIWLVGRKTGPDSVGWPNAGEIDIMEAVGYEEAQGQYRLHSALHRSPDFLWPDGRGRTGQGMSIELEEPPSEKFHTWTMVWEKDSVEIFVDQRRVTRMEVQQDDGSRVVEDRAGFFRFDPGMNGEASLAWPFAKELGNEFKLILNLAYGGGWGGKNGIDDSIFDNGPVEILIDYVRIYTKNEPELLSVPVGLWLEVE